jgi:hypothetical protein
MTDAGCPARGVTPFRTIIFHGFFGTLGKSPVPGTTGLRVLKLFGLTMVTVKGDATE